MAFVSAGTALASSPHVIDEGGPYISYGGSFTSDSTCSPVRGTCLYGLNVAYTSGCSDWSTPGSGCDSSRTRYRQYNFRDQYNAVDGYYDYHAWNPSTASAYIPGKHATGIGHYIENFYYYDAQLCPQLCTVQSYADINQMSYSETWVPTSFNSRQVNWMYLSNANSQTTSWYNIAWEAIRVVY